MVARDDLEKMSREGIVTGQPSEMRNESTSNHTEGTVCHYEWEVEGSWESRQVWNEIMMRSGLFWVAVAGYRNWYL